MCFSSNKGENKRFTERICEIHGGIEKECKMHGAYP